MVSVIYFGSLLLWYDYLLELVYTKAISRHRLDRAEWRETLACTYVDRLKTGTHHYINAQQVSLGTDRAAPEAITSWGGQTRLGYRELGSPCLSVCVALIQTHTEAPNMHLPRM